MNEPSPRVQLLEVLAVGSIDVLLSFGLVALVIGGGRLRGMPPAQLTAWNACVILNVLGAGLSRFGESLRNLRRE